MFARNLTLPNYKRILEEDMNWTGLDAEGIHTRLSLLIDVFMDMGYDRGGLIQKAWEWRFSIRGLLSPDDITEKSFTRKQISQPKLIAVARKKQGAGGKNLPYPRPLFEMLLATTEDTAPLIKTVRIAGPGLKTIEVDLVPGSCNPEDLLQITSNLQKDKNLLTKQDTTDIKRLSTHQHKEEAENRNVIGCSSETKNVCLSPSDKGIDISSGADTAVKSKDIVDTDSDKKRRERIPWSDEGESAVSQWEAKRIQIRGV